MMPLGLGLGVGLRVGQGLLLLLQLVSAGHELFERGVGAASELPLEGADPVGELPLLGAQRLGPCLRTAPRLVGDEPRIHQLRAGDALDPRGLLDGVASVTSDMRQECRRPPSELRPLRDRGWAAS